MLEHYPWPGNIRQLKNVTEQMSILDDRRIDADTLLGYLPKRIGRGCQRDPAGTEAKDADGMTGAKSCTRCCLT